MENQSRESQEARCLFALREARTGFINDLLSCAYEHLGSPKKLSDVDRVLLRSEETYAIAEFYYVLDENKLADPRKIRLFLQGHNEAMREYASNKDRRDLKAVVALAKAGLINRINSTNVLLISNGKLEHYFRKHLTAIVSAVKAGARRRRSVA